MIAVIADTGFFVGLLNANDEHHELAKSIFESDKYAYITTMPVLTEACHLLMTRLGPRAAIGLMGSAAAGELKIAPSPVDAASRAHKLMQRYADLPMDLADASLVILAEDLGHGRILSTDERDFKSYRWKNHVPFENLMLSAR